MGEIVLQIFSGGFVGASVTFDAVKAKLDTVLPELKVSKVIIGWSPDAPLYERLCAYLRARGIEIYLWLPVFSDIGALAHCMPVVDICGEAVGGGRWHEAEGFEFYCPNDRRNADNVIKVFETRYASVGFTGVFLDKIRYPTFANGRGGVLTCFCPACVNLYKAHGFDADALRKAAADLPRASVPLGITRYEHGIYAFGDGVWGDFFAVKSRCVTDAVKSLCGYFRCRGYKVGLDVLAPFMGRLAGQDIAALSADCDFVKPMLYRVTRAPAGLPHELDAMMNAVCPDSDAKRRAFYDMLGVDAAAWPFDMGFTLRELDAVLAAARCPAYAGVEVNRKEGVADAQPEYVRESASAYLAAGAAGLVLSWDVMDAPLDNVLSVLPA